MEILQQAGGHNVYFDRSPLVQGKTMLAKKIKPSYFATHDMHEAFGDH